MTRPLRSLHWRVMLVLALLLPLVFLAALLARREVPVMPAAVIPAAPALPAPR